MASTVELFKFKNSLELDTGNFDKGMTQSQYLAKNAMSSILSASQSALGVAGVAGLFKKATMAAMAYGQEVADVSTLTEQSMKRIKTGVLNLANVLGMPSRNMHALYEAISAGTKGSEEQLTQFTGKVGALARATRAGQFATMDAVTTMMNSYNLGIKDSGQVFDFFFQVVKKGKVIGPELAQSLGMVVNTASEAGLSIDTLGAAIATLSRTMPTSVAIFSLNQALNAFLRPTDKAKRVAREYGITMNFATLKAKGFTKAMDDIRIAVGGNKAALSTIFGRIRAIRAAFALTGKQYKNYHEILGDFSNKAGSADEAFKKQTASTQAQFVAMQVAWQKAMINWGDALEYPTRSLSKLGEGVSEAFSKTTLTPYLLTAYLAIKAIRTLLASVAMMRAQYAKLVAHQIESAGIKVVAEEAARASAKVTAKEAQAHHSISQAQMDAYLAMLMIK